MEPQVMVEKVSFSAPPCNGKGDPFRFPHKTLKGALGAAAIAGQAHSRLFILSKQASKTGGMRVYYVDHWANFESKIVGKQPFFELIADGQCHFYADVDIVSPTEDNKAITAKVAQGVEAFYRALKASVKDNAIASAYVIYSTAHKPGKYSCHIVMRLYDQDGKLIMFSNFASVHAAIKRFGSPVFVALLDPQVYRRNGEMRMLTAVKLDEPNRPFVLDSWAVFDEPKGVTASSHRGSQLTLSTITTFDHVSGILRLADDRAPSLKRTLATLNAASVAPPIPVTGVQGTMIELTLFDAIEVVRTDIEQQLRDRGISNMLRLLHFYPSRSVPAREEGKPPTRMGPSIVFSSLGKDCEIKGAPHASNNVYYVFFPETRKFYQGCFDTECAYKRSRARYAGNNNSASRTDDNKAKGCMWYVNYETFPATEAILKHEALSSPLVRADGIFSSSSSIPSSSSSSSIGSKPLDDDTVMFTVDVSVSGMSRRLELELEDMFGNPLI